MRLKHDKTSLLSSNEKQGILGGHKMIFDTFERPQ